MVSYYHETKDVGFIHAKQMRGAMQCPKTTSSQITKMQLAKLPTA
jgi:hypothetical protein